MWECVGDAQELFTSEAFTEQFAEFLLTENLAVANEAMMGLGFAKALCMIHSQNQRDARRFLMGNPRSAREPEEALLKPVGCMFVL